MIVHKLLFLLVISMFSAQGALAQNTSVPVLSGGVGIESGDELRPQQANFNLKFVFTLMEGDYVADVEVKIADAGGKVVVEQTTDGPIFMARLPAGNYVATLTYEGVAQTRKLALREKGLRTEQVRWKRSEADGPAML
jgi:hypothetical protein